MPRNLDLLPDKELFDKSSSIVEYVRDCNIEIQYKQGDNWCKRNKKDEYLINIATPTNKSIPKYTALLHELAHILYQSPFYQVDKLIADWNNPEFYFNVYNLLEDQRIESHLKREYLAYNKRFNTCLKGLGKTIPNEELIDEPINANPLNILFAIRCMRTETVWKTRYFTRLDEAMTNVEGTDRFGALRILITIKDILDDYLEQREERRKELTSHEGIEPAKELSDMANERSVQRTAHKQERNRHNDQWTEEESENENEQIPENLKELLNSDSSEISNEVKDDLVGEGKELGEEEYNDIQDKILEEATTYDNTPSCIKRIQRSIKEPVPNWSTANKLNKIFKHLQMGLRPFVDYHGHDIDVDSYINNAVKGTDLGKSFTNLKTASGGSIVLSIDASSSMCGYERIDIARNLVATLYESLKSISNIELRGNIWGSDGKGNVGLTDIRKLSDVNQVTVTRDYNGTPTHLALEYSARQLKEMKGSKKLMIVITDGVPNYWKNNVRMQRNHYYNLCKKSYQKSLRVTPNIVFVVINPRLWVHETMKELFGRKNVISVPNAEIGSEKVIRQFRNVVMSTLV